jgi:hypothetical protein
MHKTSSIYVEMRNEYVIYIKIHDRKVALQISEHR